MFQIIEHSAIISPNRFHSLLGIDLNKPEIRAKSHGERKADYLVTRSRTERKSFDLFDLDCESVSQYLWEREWFRLWQTLWKRSRHDFGIFSLITWLADKPKNKGKNNTNFRNGTAGRDRRRVTKLGRFAARSVAGKLEGNNERRRISTISKR